MRERTLRLVGAAREPEPGFGERRRFLSLGWPDVLALAEVGQQGENQPGCQFMGLKRSFLHPQ